MSFEAGREGSGVDHNQALMEYRTLRRPVELAVASEVPDKPVNEAPAPAPAPVLTEFEQAHAAEIAAMNAVHADRVSANETAEARREDGINSARAARLRRLAYGETDPKVGNHYKEVFDNGTAEGFAKFLEVMQGRNAGTWQFEAHEQATPEPAPVVAQVAPNPRTAHAAAAAAALALLVQERPIRGRVAQAFLPKNPKQRSAPPLPAATTAPSPAEPEADEPELVPTTVTIRGWAIGYAPRQELRSTPDGGQMWNSDDAAETPDLVVLSPDGYLHCLPTTFDQFSRQIVPVLVDTLPRALPLGKDAYPTRPLCGDFGRVSQHNIDGGPILSAMFQPLGLTHSQYLAKVAAR